MTPVNVLVIFASQSGRTEQLALAAAVGAVQARANIRIRRLSEQRTEGEQCDEVLARMRREYIPPARADAVWADMVIIGVNGRLAGMSMDSADATAYARKATEDVRMAKSGGF